MNTTTRIIIGANAYASVKYSVDDIDGLHIGTIDFPLFSDNYMDALYEMTNLCVEVEDTGVW